MSLFFTGAIIGAVALSFALFPWLYSHVFILIPGVAKYSPGDVLNRLVLLTIFLVFGAVYPKLGIKSIKLGKPNRRRLLLAALSTGLAFLAVIIFFFSKYIMGHASINWDWIFRVSVIRTLLWYLLGALTVGFIEEVFFRGVALQVLLQDHRTKVLAIPLSAIIFAIVHFIDFRAVSVVLLSNDQSFYDFEWIRSLDGHRFIFLTMLGIILAYMCTHTGSLYTAIGFHAGVVFAARVAGEIFLATPGNSMNFLSQKVQDIVLLSIALIVPFILSRRLPSYRKANLTESDS